MQIGKKKLKTWGLLAVAVLAVLLFTGKISVPAQFSLGGDGAVDLKPDNSGAKSQIIDTTDLTQAVTVTLETNDKYNTGSAVTTQNMIRLKGSNTRTDVAGAGTFSANQGDEYEIVIGIDSNDEAGEPYGRVFEFSVPKGKATARIPELVHPQVSSVSDISTAYFNNNDQATTGTTTSAGGNYNLAIKFTGKFQKDYGNFYCEDKLGYGNLLVAKYNTTQVDKIEGVSIGSTALKDVAVPLAVTNDLTATGYALKAWGMPALESNEEFKVRYVLDSDDTIAVNTTVSALTWALYDASIYLDNDDNTVKCGVADEDDTLIGVASKVTVTPSIGA